jgi:hypothetical protein
MTKNITELINRGSETGETQQIISIVWSVTI